MEKNTKGKNIAGKKIDNDLQEIGLARIMASPEDLIISIGSNEYNKAEIIKGVEESTELGKAIADAQLRFLKDMASGKIYEPA